VPWCGYRRKSYLIASSVVSTLGFAGLACLSLEQPAPGLLLALLLVPAVGVAFADVVVDALMIEHGPPAHLTGRLQSIQWASIYGAAILTGLAGGQFQRARHIPARRSCCAPCAASWMGCVAATVTEPPPPVATQSLRDTLRVAATVTRWPLLIGVTGMVLLWHFNPFSQAVLYLHMTEQLGFEESFAAFTKRSKRPPQSRPAPCTEPSVAGCRCAVWFTCRSRWAFLARSATGRWPMNFRHASWRSSSASRR